MKYSQLDISPTFHNDYSEKQIDVEHIIVMGVDMALTWNVTDILSHLNNENKTPETV